MAQTIALQRGVASITWDGTTQTTLFTQSGGTATRVVFNGCGAYNGSASAGMLMSIFVKLSGGTGSYCVASVWIGNSANNASIDFRPGNTNAVGGGTNGSAAINSGATVLAFNTASTYSMDVNMVYANLFGGMNASGGFGSGNIYEFCPAQFWIGPGDAIIFKCRAATSNSGQVAYSFTTITES